MNKIDVTRPLIAIRSDADGENWKSPIDKSLRCPISCEFSLAEAERSPGAWTREMRNVLKWQGRHSAPRALTPRREDTCQKAPKLF